MRGTSEILLSNLIGSVVFEWKIFPLIRYNTNWRKIVGFVNLLEK